MTWNEHVIDRIDLNSPNLRNAGCVALLTPHDSYDLDWITAVRRWSSTHAMHTATDLYSNVVRL